MPQTMRVARELARSASLPQPSLTAVPTAWDAQHRTLASALATQDTPTVRTALARNLTHLRAHVAVVQRRLQEV